MTTQLFGEAPTNRTSQWRAAPDTRGTFQILSSCLITLSLCVWTEIHLNVPEEDFRSRINKQLLRKAGWLILGLLAPEMVRSTSTVASARLNSSDVIGSVGAWLELVLRSMYPIGFYDVGLVAMRIRNWPDNTQFQLGGILFSDDETVFDSDARPFALAFAAAGFVYGGFHLLAWNAPFASRTHCLLWRISALSITASSVLSLPLRLSAASLNKLGHDRPFSGVLFCLHFILAATWIVSLILYPLGRVYLVVECFLSLPYLPDAVFQQSQWVAYFPHLM